MKYMSVPVSVLLFITAIDYELLPLFSLTMHRIQSGDGHQGHPSQIVGEGVMVQSY